MADTVNVTQALDAVSQKHEKDIVIEFGPDRILHYIGVYLAAFLAVAAKVTELAATSLSCHPAGNNTVDGSLVTYATSYCWESATVASNISLDACGNESSIDESNLLGNPVLLKSLIRGLPYAMIVEAILYALPSIFWHQRVGAKLMGHMKFMKLLLSDMYEDVKQIETVIYRRNTSYDSCSYYLDGWTGFRPNYRNDPTEEAKQKSRKCFEVLRRRKRRDGGERSIEETGLNATSGDSQSPQEDHIEQTKNGNTLTDLIFGDMRDRHIFSMLCFENFSSLEHHPYILSIYKLSAAAQPPRSRGFTGRKIHGMLLLLCNENNFGGRFLVKSYFYKHLIGTIISIVVLCATGAIFAGIAEDGWNSESYRCHIIYHSDVCMICTIRRKLDLIAYLFANLVINLLYLVLSIIQLIFVRRSNKRAVCHYFEEISDTGSVALTYDTS